MVNGAGPDDLTSWRLTAIVQTTARLCQPEFVNVSEGFICLVIVLTESLLALGLSAALYEQLSTFYWGVAPTIDN